MEDIFEKHKTMDSYWSPTTPLFSYSNTNLHAPVQALQFENGIEDNVFDHAFEEFTWTAAQCEDQEHQFNDFILPESFDQPMGHFESMLFAHQFEVWSSTLTSV